MSLPPANANQAFWTVAALEAGQIRLQLDWFITGTGEEEHLVAPSLSFLLRHSSDPKNTLVVDLGIRKDHATGYPPGLNDLVKRYPMMVEQDVSESLEKGGIAPSAIDTVLLTHLHFDHIGDTRPFSNATFLVGGDAKQLITPGYPADPNSHYASNLLPQDRTKFLSAQEWPAIGPFPHGLDYFGDGSLYVVDSPGHLQGHINVLARTSEDGAWIFLAGDSGHHWGLLRGGEISEHPVYGCAHINKEQAKAHLERIKQLLSNERARVMLAHDEPWYKVNRGGDNFGQVSSLLCDTCKEPHDAISSRLLFIVRLFLCV